MEREWELNTLEMECASLDTGVGGQHPPLYPLWAGVARPHARGWVCNGAAAGPLMYRPEMGGGGHGRPHAPTRPRGMGDYCP